MCSGKFASKINSNFNQNKIEKQFLNFSKLETTKKNDGGGG